jgi:pimeloyl-ACP methyl ester carboxylesterase
MNDSGGFPVGDAPQFLEHGGNRLAWRMQKGEGPLIIWLGGYNSDMRGTKAERLAMLAKREGLAFLRFDYSGHGESGGRFADGTISQWRAEP